MATDITKKFQHFFYNIYFIKSAIKSKITHGHGDFKFAQFSF